MDFTRYRIDHGGLFNVEHGICQPREIPEIREIQSFSMENVDGRNISLADTQGKVRLFYFYFTSCPDVCPITTFTLSQVQDLLKEDGTFGDKASFVSISFDPKVDTRSKPLLTVSTRIIPVGISARGYGQNQTVR